MDVAWLGDEMLMTCSTDNTLKIWHTDGGQEFK